MQEFHLTFPKFQKNVTSTNLVFSIGNIKSRVPSVCFMKFHCYDMNDDEILVDSEPVHIGERFVITSSYRTFVEAFEISETIFKQTFSFGIELILLGITSENPCWFNEVMLEEGLTRSEYHKPDEADNIVDVNFNNNNYAVLTDGSSKSLQVIRPYKDRFNTKKLTASKYTVLAPHLEDEVKYDTPSNLMMEFINQTEQYIQIKK